MLSFQLKNFIVSPSQVTNYWKKHPHSLRKGSFPFDNITSKYSGSNNTTAALSLSLNWSLATKQKTNLNNTAVACYSSDSIQEQEQEEYKVLTAMRSSYNDIAIVETAEARILLLDSTHNVHSILKKDQKWTGSYWDEFASLPAIIPEGPIAILGLGAGTAAHLILDLWPSLVLEGWEIDRILIDKAREYFGLSDLEKPTATGGILNVHIDDALSPAENGYGKYAGIVIDLFSEGKVLPQLQEAATWLKLNDRLMPEGRFMVNCGGINEKSDNADGIIHPESIGDTWIENSTIKALSEAFPEQVNWKRMPETQGANYLALTGPLPDLTIWSSKVPDPLTENVRRWRPCGSIP